MFWTCLCVTVNHNSQEKGSKDGEETFESLETHFQGVLSELAQNPSMDKFSQEYQKLNAALKNSHENEKRLMTKCRELNAEIVSSSTKVAIALKLKQEDESTIKTLKKVHTRTCFSFANL